MPVGCFRLEWVAKGDECCSDLPLMSLVLQACRCSNKSRAWTLWPVLGSEMPITRSCQVSIWPHWWQASLLQLSEPAVAGVAGRLSRLNVALAHPSAV